MKTNAITSLAYVTGSPFYTRWSGTTGRPNNYELSGMIVTNFLWIHNVMKYKMRFIAFSKIQVRHRVRRRICEQVVRHGQNSRNWLPHSCLPRKQLATICQNMGGRKGIFCEERCGSRGSRRLLLPEPMQSCPCIRVIFFCPYFCFIY